MSKYIIREQMEPETPDWMEYLDVFIIQGRDTLLNGKDLEKIRTEIDDVINELEDYSAQEVMNDYNIPYSPEAADELKRLEYIKHEEDRIAKYMTLKTGDPWETRTVRGYCQSDWADVIYNAAVYNKKDVDIIGDYCFGCFKEFSITDPDGETVYGYYVTDHNLSNYSDQEYKEIVCSMEGIKPEDAILEMIEDVKTVRQPVYRTA